VAHRVLSEHRCSHANITDGDAVPSSQLLSSRCSGAPASYFFYVGNVAVLGGYAVLKPF